MRRGCVLPVLLACVMTVVSVGCRAPGQPAPGPDVVRPEQIVDFPTLYQQNCSACHGAKGKSGAAVSLANPVYLEIAGADTLRTVTANGVNGSLMPPFAKSRGGTLTDRQVEVLVQGMIHQWGRPPQLDGLPLPPYSSSRAGNVSKGQKSFVTFCARCHGADGTGPDSRNANKPRGNGSLVDASYLALVSDQSLRSTIIAGWPEEGMPDWRSDMAAPTTRAMTDEEITDTVAWLAAHRTKFAGQPYPQRP